MINKKPGSGKKKFTIYKISFFQKIGILLLVTFSLLASIRLFTHAVNFRGVVIGNDDISCYENLFSELKKMLSGEKVVGYITDKAPEEIFADADATAEYYLTQYAISPIIIDIRKRNGFIVGNFHTNWLTNNAKDKKLLLIKDLGNGIMLLKGAEESK